MGEHADISEEVRERLMGELFDCPLHEHLNAMSGPPRQTGRFRVIEQGEPPSSWLWIRAERAALPSTCEPDAEAVPGG